MTKITEVIAYPEEIKEVHGDAVWESFLARATKRPYTFFVESDTVIKKCFLPGAEGNLDGWGLDHAVLKWSNENCFRVRQNPDLHQWTFEFMWWEPCGGWDEDNRVWSYQRYVKYSKGVTL